MAKEIERKFLVTILPAFITSQYRGISILQGYITESASSRQVRIRSKGDHYYLTVKDAGLLEREEVEISLSADQFHALWPLTQKRFIRKNRYEIAYGEYTIEVDVFEDKLIGLIIAEVEFGSVEESKKLDVPDWFGKEVTHDMHFTNSQLASNQQIPDARI